MTAASGTQLAAQVAQRPPNVLDLAIDLFIAKRPVRRPEAQVKSKRFAPRPELLTGVDIEDVDTLEQRGSGADRLDDRCGRDALGEHDREIAAYRRERRDVLVEQRVGGAGKEHVEVDLERGGRRRLAWLRHGGMQLRGPAGGLAGEHD